ncbi:hypothetical protein AB9F26_05055 [Falsihalocynthiibacter sp. BN13B15]|uniref:hypothetical protein n=1 Tax=Falsihalocynthiibacter sp. BN13B15 TaxID=3240871 RepID=UPI00350F5F29
MPKDFTKRNAHVVDLARLGMKFDEIREQTDQNMSRSTFNVIIREARERGIKFPARRRARRPKAAYVPAQKTAMELLKLEPHTSESLRRIARRRRTTVEILSAQILSATANMAAVKFLLDQRYSR